MRSRLLLLFLLALLPGCAERWAKPGGTPQAFEAARTGCEAQAYGAFPPLPRTVLVAPGHFTPARQVCRRRGPFTDCWLEGGYWVPPQFAEVDDNQPGRRQQTRACLFAQGWRPVESEAEAAAVTAAVPAAPAIAGDPSFTLVNRGQRVLQDVYASPSPETGWGPDRLGDQVLRPGGRMPISLPGGECRYDLRFVWIGGDAEERRAVNTCAFREYTLK
jgi:hypothetical protein